MSTATCAKDNLLHTIPIVNTSLSGHAEPNGQQPPTNRQLSDHGTAPTETVWKRLSGHPPVNTSKQVSRLRDWDFMPRGLEWKINRLMLQK